MDGNELRKIQEIELSQLKLRYAYTRVERPEGVAVFAGSIERFGQIIPVTVLKEETKVILLGGCLGVKALKALGVACPGPSWFTFSHFRKYFHVAARPGMIGVEF